MDVLRLLHVRARGLSLSEGDHATLERRIAFALDRFADRIRRVDVVFDDVNGPRGGVDVTCHVRVVLRDGGSLDVASIAESPLASASIALERLRRGLARRAGGRAPAERRSGASLRTQPPVDTDVAEAG